jgi:hypothetical protein
MAGWLAWAKSARAVWRSSPSTTDGNRVRRPLWDRSTLIRRDESRRYPHQGIKGLRPIQALNAISASAPRPASNGSGRRQIRPGLSRAPQSLPRAGGSSTTVGALGSGSTHPHARRRRSRPAPPRTRLREESSCQPSSVWSWLCSYCKWINALARELRNGSVVSPSDDLTAICQ